METKVVFKPLYELSWGFDNNGPSVALNEHGGYRASETVDPFPGYPHDKALVEEMVGLVTSKFPITWPVTYYILSHEFLGRTNAYAQASAFDYGKKIEGAKDGEEQYSRIPYIVLSGKRIPIMPAMTRYLVSHEYGHVVEDWIAKQRGQTDSELLKGYSEMRGLTETPKSYGGGWHITPGEIFANDFRILMTGLEAEFWPHPCSRPEYTPAVCEWWGKATELLDKSI